MEALGWAHLLLGIVAGAPGLRCCALRPHRRARAGPRSAGSTPARNVAPVRSRLQATRGVAAGVTLAALAVAIVAALDALPERSVWNSAGVRRLAATGVDAYRHRQAGVSLGGVAAFAVLGGMLAAAIRARP